MFYIMITRNLFLIFTVIYISEIKLIATVNDEDDDDDENESESSFLEPREISDKEDIFVRDDKEYVFVNDYFDYITASVTCEKNYDGRLAFVTTKDLAYFLAEALSETNLEMDALWIGAKLRSKGWCWYEGDHLIKPVTKEILNLFVDYSKSIAAPGRNCLTMGRLNHDIPHFPYYNCSVLRHLMCERDANGGGNGSTHYGWIKLGKRSYKIFQESVTWSDAQAKCIIYDENSRLAVVASFSDAQSLGRYLLIGRPTLENAWIGARFYETQYNFKTENIVLSNVSDADGYPPWRKGVMQRKYGCLLLDRHLANITLFVEARCDRLRSYICYKRDRKAIPDFIDIIVGQWGYRLFFSRQVWHNARDKCNTYKEKYEGKLAEIREKTIISHLIYVTGQNKTAVQHIWLGGEFNTMFQKWFWDSDNSEVDIEMLNWIRNSTYTHSVESINRCLNMDRENHLTAIHYGTNCIFEQSFVCMFPQDKLTQLIKDEKNMTLYRHSTST